MQKQFLDINDFVKNNNIYCLNVSFEEILPLIKNKKNDKLLKMKYDFKTEIVTIKEICVRNSMHYALPFDILKLIISFLIYPNNKENWEKDY